MSLLAILVLPVYTDYVLAPWSSFRVSKATPYLGNWGKPAGRMAQWLKVLVTEADNLSLIPGVAREMEQIPVVVL